jgi:mono/diheme cytochrome c family protein
MVTTWRPAARILGAGIAVIVVAGLTTRTPVSAQSAATSQAAVTFTKDIAPLLQRSCQECHRPGSIAPMSLLTYEDARPWARSIKQKVSTREMPPWFVDRNIGIQKFKGDPSLSDAEIATIAKWVDNGAPMGNSADMPAQKKFDEQEKWKMGTPDIIIKMPKPYKLASTGPDNFVDVLVDPGFKEDVYVSAIETKPLGNGFKVIHHATTQMVEDPDSDPNGIFFNEYAIGKEADVFPANAGRLIKAGSKIIWNLHLHPDGEETDVQLEMGLKVFPKSQVPKYVEFTQHMGDMSDLDLPGGQVTRTDGYFRLPKPALITAFQPHMHAVGGAMCVEALYPDVRADSARPGAARTQTLNCVSHFNFGWSTTYPYADDVAPLLPAGTVIHVTAWSDNSPSNKFLQTDPRNWVGSGQRTVDGMAFAWMSLYYLDEADYQQRLQDRQRGAGASTQQQ